MKMYNADGLSAIVDKEQLPTMLAAGWTKNPPEKKVEAPVEAPEEVKEDASSNDSKSEVLDEEKPATGRKRRPIKKTEGD